MSFQLTYALKESDEIMVAQVPSSTLLVDMVGAVADALIYIEKEHGEGSVNNLKGISILLP